MVYDVLSVICAVACTNYAAMPFMLLDVRDSLKGWAAVGWYGHVLVFGGMAFFYLGGSHYLKGVQNRRVARVKRLDQKTSDLATNQYHVSPPERSTRISDKVNASRIRY